ncbi:MAG: sulfatase [Planctomycetota bacterium]
MRPRLLAVPLLLAACDGGATAPEPPPATRLRLFDHMERATADAPPVARPGEASVIAYDFDGEASSPKEVWFAVQKRRKLQWRATGAMAVPEGGLTGGALRIGPGVPEDLSRAVLLVPLDGRSKVVVEARVRVEGEEASSRECLRVYQYEGTPVVDPTLGRNAEGGRARRLLVDEASRRTDASGWDRVRSEVVTKARAATLEIHLLHRTDESPEAVSWFDDVEIRVAPLGEASYLEDLVARYRPRDGQESTTPWRLRVSLQGETRDCALVRLDAPLAFDVEVPPAASAPRLRFGVGSFREVAREAGDGVRLAVEFVDDEGAIELDAVVIDPKNESDDRAWRDVLVDLAPVAGRRGSLAFRASDVDEEPDELDVVLVATPRIEPSIEPPSAPNVLLIGVDTLRADRMSAFGYERDTTPNLAAVADEGVLFTAARSPAPWTLPSFSSMLTSLYPSAHGAGRGGHDEWEAIDPTTVSIAEVLARSGYETAGVVSNGLISPRYGLDQGFDRYRSSWNIESVESDAPRVAAFVRDHTATPWLVFWHIMDPHLPYVTPEEQRATFADAAYDGRFAGGGRRGPAVPFDALDPRPGRRWFTHEGPPPLPDLTEADARFVSDYYDAEVAEMDAGVGLVFEALRASGQWDRTIIAFVADHGEGLGDHGHYHHGYTLFDDQVHVPMILRIPDAHRGRVIKRPVSTVDLVPTLLGVLGIPAPEDAHGVDRLAGGGPAADATFIESPTYDSSAQKAWVEGRFKCLWDPVFHTEALYDLEADPAETKDVKDAHPDVVARARRALEEFRVAHLAAGRFHLRVRGRKGQQLRVRIETDDLFDANYLTRPSIDERDISMDLERSYLELETVMEGDRLELRFWCRGANLEVEASLDGKALGGLTVDDAAGERTLPASVARASIPERVAEDMGWPRPGRATLWLEAGASEALPVVNTPEELDRLRELGYAR